MEISKKLDYAMRMLAAVTKAEEGEVVSVRVVAENEQIPYSFARTIQHEMVRAGLLETTRGPHGGMSLAVDPHKTTLFDVVQAIEGPIKVVGTDFSGANSSGGETDGARFGLVWRELELLVRTFLESVTLHQLASEGLAPCLAKGTVFPVVPMEQLGGPLGD